ncbi:MAG: hypothetical protein HQL40_08570 [Alphaproteobacteria bacterium]|nr:hypothetical protein [Alphaproteobacteria bacterium]
MSRWFGFFFDAFDCLASKLSKVIMLDGCREGWLQAELAMYADRLTEEGQFDPCGFKVNRFPLARGKRRATADCSAGGRWPMVAEIKIVGCLAKNIDGGPIKPYRELLPGPIEVTQSMLDGVRQGEGSILADVARLGTVNDHQRFMVVVVPDGDAHSFKVARALQISSRQEWRQYNGFGVMVAQI